jgi:ribose transport system substrate-binding protein
MQMRRAILATATAALMTTAAVGAKADDFVDNAKKVVAAATSRVDKWDGPTTGPKAAAGKTVIYVAGDMRNGGIQGVADGVKEAADVIGWNMRVIDGQGTVGGQATALSQAIALKPDAIILGGSDAVQQKSDLEQAQKQGIVLVGWHAGPKPGPMDGAPIFANVTSDSMEVAKVAAMYAIAQSDGHAGVVVFADSTYAIAIAKGRAMEAVIKQCSDCSVLAFEDTPLADTANRIPQLTTTLLGQFGPKWTYSLGINDLYFDFMAPSLTSAGLKGDGAPYNISAGDGSVSAYSRIRDKDYQAATVPEPLTMQGWQLIDEINRAFAGEKWSGYVPGVHLVTPENIAYDGGPNNVFDPDNHYRDEYKSIWGK